MGNSSNQVAPYAKLRIKSEKAAPKTIEQDRSRLFSASAFSDFIPCFILSFASHETAECCVAIISIIYYVPWRRPNVIAGLRAPLIGYICPGAAVFRAMVVVMVAAVERTSGEALS